LPTANRAIDTDTKRQKKSGSGKANPAVEGTLKQKRCKDHGKKAGDTNRFCEGGGGRVTWGEGVLGGKTGFPRKNSLWETHLGEILEEYNKGGGADRGERLSYKPGKKNPRGGPLWKALLQKRGPENYRAKNRENISKEGAKRRELNPEN